MQQLTIDSMLYIPTGECFGPEDWIGAVTTNQAYPTSAITAQEYGLNTYWAEVKKDGLGSEGVGYAIGANKFTAPYRLTK